ncbi:TPA: hypothetical protein HA219_02005 [Candidatus Woesearchaeota archaeon]|nr:hypothetical protein [Candidatus Woesearchaeota archaeon]HIH39474.1 hypothetical protein [Candidatus Woesearchaeota archaeon]
MKKKKITKLPVNMIVLTVIFIVVASFLILPTYVKKTNSKTKEQAKQIQVEAAKEGAEACSMQICKNYVGFRYDEAKDKCYCYDAEGVAMERSVAEEKDITIEKTNNTSVNDASLGI